LSDSASASSVEELACEARAGSSDAFGALARRFTPALRRYLRRRCAGEQDAEDLCQDTLLRAMENLARYDPRRPFGAWLFTIAARLAATRGRRQRPTATLDERDIAAGGEGPAELAAQREAGCRLWSAAAATLDARQYEALWLRYAGGLAVAEIARRMGLTRTHVKVLLFRARRKLQETR